MAFPVKNLTQVFVLVVLFCFVKSIISNLYEAYKDSDIKKLTPPAILEEMLSTDNTKRHTNENESMVNIAALAVLAYLCANKMC